jgi:hypothetical protein
MTRLLALACLSLLLVATVAPDADAMRGGGGGAVRGPGGGGAVRGPGGGVAVRGPGGNVAVRGAGIGAGVVAGAAVGAAASAYYTPAAFCGYAPYPPC